MGVYDALDLYHEQLENPVDPQELENEKAELAQAELERTQQQEANKKRDLENETRMRGEMAKGQEWEHGNKYAQLDTYHEELEKQEVEAYKNKVREDEASGIDQQVERALKGDIVTTDNVTDLYDSNMQNYLDARMKWSHTDANDFEDRPWWTGGARDLHNANLKAGTDSLEQQQKDNGYYKFETEYKADVFGLHESSGQQKWESQMEEWKKSGFPSKEEQKEFLTEIYESDFVKQVNMKDLVKKDFGPIRFQVSEGAVRNVRKFVNAASAGWIDPYIQHIPHESTLEQVGAGLSGIAGMLTSFALGPSQAGAGITSGLGSLYQLARGVKVAQHVGKASKSATLAKSVTTAVASFNVHGLATHGSINPVDRWDGVLKTVEESTLNGLIFGSIGQMTSLLKGTKLGNVAEKGFNINATRRMDIGTAVESMAIGSTIYAMHMNGADPDDPNARLDATVAAIAFGLMHGNTGTQKARSEKYMSARKDNIHLIKEVLKAEGSPKVTTEQAERIYNQIEGKIEVLLDNPQIREKIVPISKQIEEISVVAENARTGGAAKAEVKSIKERFKKGEDVTEDINELRNNLEGDNPVVFDAESVNSRGEKGDWVAVTQKVKKETLAELDKLEGKKPIVEEKVVEEKVVEEKVAEEKVAEEVPYEKQLNAQLKTELKNRGIKWTTKDTKATLIEKLKTSDNKVDKPKTSEKIRNDIKYTTTETPEGKIVVGEYTKDMAGKKKGDTFIDEIIVPESNRRRGVGSGLLKSALEKNPNIRAQASNDKAIGMNYKLGMRAFDANGKQLSLRETRAKRKEDTSVMMRLPKEIKVEKKEPLTLSGKPELGKNIQVVGKKGGTESLEYGPLQKIARELGLKPKNQTKPELKRVIEEWRDNNSVELDKALKNTEKPKNPILDSGRIKDILKQEGTSADMLVSSDVKHSEVRKAFNELKAENPNLKANSGSKYDLLRAIEREVMGQTKKQYEQLEKSRTDINTQVKENKIKREKVEKIVKESPDVSFEDTLGGALKRKFGEKLESSIELEERLQRDYNRDSIDELTTKEKENFHSELRLEENYESDKANLGKGIEGIIGGKKNFMPDGKMGGRDIIKYGARVGAYHIRKGAKSFQQFAKVMITEFGKKIKPHLKRMYAQAQDYIKNPKFGLSTEMVNADGTPYTKAQLKEHHAVEFTKKMIAEDFSETLGVPVTYSEIRQIGQKGPSKGIIFQNADMIVKDRQGNLNLKEGFRFVEGEEAFAVDQNMNTNFMRLAENGYKHIAFVAGGGENVNPVVLSQVGRMVSGKGKHSIGKKAFDEIVESKTSKQGEVNIDGVIAKVNSVLKKSGKETIVKEELFRDLSASDKAQIQGQVVYVAELKGFAKGESRGTKKHETYDHTQLFVPGSLKEVEMPLFLNEITSQINRGIKLTPLPKEIKNPQEVIDRLGHLEPRKPKVNKKGETQPFTDNQNRVYAEKLLIKEYEKNNAGELKATTDRLGHLAKRSSTKNPKTKEEIPESDYKYAERLLQMEAFQQGKEKHHIAGWKRDRHSSVGSQQGWLSVHKSESAIANHLMNMPKSELVEKGSVTYASAHENKLLSREAAVDLVHGEANRAFNLNKARISAKVLGVGTSRPREAVYIHGEGKSHDSVGSSEPTTITKYTTDVKAGEVHLLSSIDGLVGGKKSQLDVTNFYHSKNGKDNLYVVRTRGKDALFMAEVLKEMGIEHSTIMEKGIITEVHIWDKAGNYSLKNAEGVRITKDHIKEMLNEKQVDSRVEKYVGRFQDITGAEGKNYKAAREKYIENIGRYLAENNKNINHFGKAFTEALLVHQTPKGVKKILDQIRDAKARSASEIELAKEKSSLETKAGEALDRLVDNGSMGNKNFFRENAEYTISQKMQDAATVGAHIIKRGAQNFQAFAKGMIKSMGVGIKPYLKKIYNQAKKLYKGVVDYLKNPTIGASIIEVGPDGKPINVKPALTKKQQLAKMGVKYTHTKDPVSPERLKKQKNKLSGTIHLVEAKLKSEKVVTDTDLKNLKKDLLGVTSLKEIHASDSQSSPLKMAAYLDALGRYSNRLRTVTIGGKEKDIQHLITKEVERDSPNPLRAPVEEMGVAIVGEKVKDISRSELTDVDLIADADFSIGRKRRLWASPSERMGGKYGKRFIRAMKITEDYFDAVQQKYGVPVYDAWMKIRLGRQQLAAAEGQWIGKMTNTLKEFGLRDGKPWEEAFVRKGATESVEEVGYRIHDALTGKIERSALHSKAEKKAYDVMKEYYNDPATKKAYRTMRFMEWYNGNKTGVSGVKEDIVQLKNGEVLWGKITKSKKKGFINLEIEGAEGANGIVELKSSEVKDVSNTLKRLKEILDVEHAEGSKTFDRFHAELEKTPGLLIGKNYAPEFVAETKMQLEVPMKGVSKSFLQGRIEQKENTQFNAIDNFRKKLRADMKYLFMNEPMNNMKNLYRQGKSGMLPEEVYTEMERTMRFIDEKPDRTPISAFENWVVGNIMSTSLFKFMAGFRNYPQRFMATVHVAVRDMPKFLYNNIKLSSTRGGAGNIEKSKFWKEADPELKRFFLETVKQDVALNEEFIYKYETPILDRLDLGPAKLGTAIKRGKDIYVGVDTASRWVNFKSSYDHITTMFEKGVPFRKIKNRIMWEYLPESLKDQLRHEIQAGNTKYVAMRIAEQMTSSKWQFRYDKAERTMHEKTQKSKWAFKLATYSLSQGRKLVQSSVNLSDNVMGMGKELRVGKQNARFHMHRQKTFQAGKELVGTLIAAQVLAEGWTAITGREDNNPYSWGTLLSGELYPFVSALQETIEPGTTLWNMIENRATGGSDKDYKRLQKQFPGDLESMVTSQVMLYRSVGVWTWEALMGRDNVKPIQQMLDKALDNRRKGGVDVDREWYDMFRHWLFSSDRPKKRNNISR